MRLLIATYSLAFQNPGGGERILNHFARELAKSGHSVTRFDPRRTDPADFDLIHYFSTLETDQWAHFKRLAPRVPLVVTPSAWIDSSWRAGFRNSIARLAKRALGWDRVERNRKLVDLWLPNTDSEARSLRRAWGIPRARIAVLPNGVELSSQTKGAADFLEAYGLTSGFLLHVGRIDPVKNQLRLLDFLEAHPERAAVFIGAPDLDKQDYLREYERRLQRLGGRVLWIRDLPPGSALLSSAYAACGAFVLPSRFETFGLAALEAAAAGAPLVLTNRLGGRDWIKGPVEWIDPERTEHWPRAIERALQRPRGEVTLNGDLSWPSVTGRLENHYARITS